jgi:TIR domain-containing protein
MPPSASGELQVFICYRRADTSGEAVALSDKLNRRRGLEVFKDVDNIRPGQDWLETVEESIEHCDVLLVLIGTDWIGRAGEEGHSLDENDHVRREIEAALTRKKAVIPILFESANLPHSEELPESMRPLLRRQSLRIRNSTFNRDLEVLVSQLRVIARQLAPAPSAASSAAGAGSSSAAEPAAAKRAAGAPARAKPLPPPPPPAARPKPEAETQPVTRAQPEAQPQAAAYVQPASYPQPAAFTQANPTYAPTQPPGQYQQSWPGPASWSAGWSEQGRPSQSATRLAQASAIGLFISGGFMAFVALIAMFDPSTLTGDGMDPDLVTAIGLLFGITAALQLFAGFGVWRRARWAGWAGGLTTGIAAGVFLITMTVVGFVLAVGEALIVAGLVMAAGAHWFR